jgi:Flp pilus assembly protein TadG
MTQVAHRRQLIEKSRRKRASTMTFIRHRRSRQPSRRGAAAVEFALTAPILFILVFSMIEFARFNMIRHGLDTAAYEGARRGIVPGATAKDVEATAKKILTAVSTVQGNVTVTPGTLTPTTTQVTVTVDVQLKKNGWLVPKLFKQTSLSRSCTLARERTDNF